MIWNDLELNDWAKFHLTIMDIILLWMMKYRVQQEQELTTRMNIDNDLWLKELSNVGWLNHNTTLIVILTFNISLL